ncbi:MAG TPA: DUF1015 family protein [Vicinamibacterales bacterium]|nr:DUF1015 family protein [Vicinamibacterales bacterium]
MARVYPFRAVRPQPAQAEAVAAVPYDVVDREEAAALAANRPHSFLHVSRAEIDLPAQTDPYDELVYRTAAANFRRMLEHGLLLQDDTPGLYVYRLRMGSHEQTGLAACFDLDEYERGVIVRHERTRRDKEDDRTRHILEVAAQTGPVFLTYPASAAVDSLVAAAASGQPLADFTADDGVHHTTWRVPDDAVPAIITAFETVPRVYIADGHHRAASALRARNAIRSKRGSTGPLEADRFLAVAFPHTQTRILPYHRVVKDLDGYTPDTFLAALRSRTRVAPGRQEPGGEGRVSMYLAGQWHEITLEPAPPDAQPAERLDVTLLQQQVLEPVLRIGDPRTDPRIGFVGGIRGAAELERLVERGDAAVAFAMHPISVDELIAISDAGGIMPPKSTWFEPKLRDGLLTHVIESGPR